MSAAPEPKLVFAHFMVGNTYPYTPDDWRADLSLAHEYGFDGFALNVGREDWQRARVAACFATAAEMRSPLRFFLSFDMSSIPGAAAADTALLAAYLREFGPDPRALRRRGKVFVSTFAGEGCLFGQRTLRDAWALVKGALDAVVPVHLVPAFAIDPARYPGLPALDGIFNWNGGWPHHLTARSPRHEIEWAALDTDDAHRRHLGGRTFMAAVSPWFFTHYGPDSWNKNWIYRGDDWLFVRRWEQLVAQRAHVDIVQVLSWNDYGESHYLAPVRGAQPRSHAWVDGLPHAAWLHVAAHFAAAFRTGAAPPVARDRLVLWARPHARAAAAAGDAVPRPANWELTDDVLWGVAFAAAPARVVLGAGADAVVVDVPAGVSKIAQALRVGGGMRAVMERGGDVVAVCDVPEFRFEGAPKVYNFNAYVASSS